ncbi:hypothetical protein M8C13_21080 [Crossiella sp. SN42]|uniref:hypothetical protein n=1 Tax=Crossiella sp. SN42 TaxID=2944808 RepID=UPI00207D4918|nr:hypothetical protein [Crossiella sp. SN42]MCO1578251.1 hypothetical protein [Crossiella sp. SN42]
MSRRTRGLLVLGAVVVLGVAALVVYTWTGRVVQPTITQQEATERVDGYIRAAIAQLPADAGFTQVVADVMSCEPSSDNGPRGRKVVSRAFETTAVPVAEFNRVFDTLKSYWVGNGYVVLEDSRPKDWYLWVQHQPDEFRLSVQGNARGLLAINASSPCVWPNGTPDPQ